MKDKSNITEKTDWYKRILDTLGLLVIVAGLYFAWDQAKQFNTSQNFSNWSDVTARTLEVDRVFVDNPGMQKFFIAGVDIKEGEADFTKASAVAGMVLDFIDSVLTRLAYNQGRLTDDILQKAAWNHYFESTFSKSPLLCRTLTKDPNSYGTETRRIGIPICKKVFGIQR